MKKEEKKQDAAKKLARKLQLDFAAIIWRRMLELDMSVETLAAKAKLPVKKVSDLLHARDHRMFQDVGRIGAALDINIHIVPEKQGQAI